MGSDLGRPDGRMSEASAERGCTRRDLLRRGVVGGLGVSLFGGPFSVGAVGSPAGGADGYGPLQQPDENGLRLPPGFTSRVIAYTGRGVGSTGYRWHPYPDGGATFATGDGGWVYVSNSEDDFDGGVGVVRFDPDGTIVDAYSILSGTRRNCGGGPTRWGTWLSCEEWALGQVWECDPLAPGSQGIVRPALGAFRHEAAAVDPFKKQLYLTEDKHLGLLYRFTPDNYPDLSSGVLEAAEITDPYGVGDILPGEVRRLAWHVVPDPTVSGGVPTRFQVPAATGFNRGEGCWFHSKRVYFATTFDGRVWVIDTVQETIRILYDISTSAHPVLLGPDNLTVTPCGDVFAAEDGGDKQIVALTPSGNVKPVVELRERYTELTGPALSPDGDRLYFSSQRRPGITFEVRGPFLGAMGVSGIGAPTATLTSAALAGASTWAARAAQAGTEGR